MAVAGEAREIVAQVLDGLAEIDLVEPLGLVQAVVHPRDAHHPGGGVGESLPRLAVGDLAALHLQEGRDDLQGVLDPVVDLPGQQILLLEQALLLGEQAGQLVDLAALAQHDALDRFRQGAGELDLPFREGAAKPVRSSTQRSKERRGSTATGPLPASTGLRGSPPQVTVLGTSGRNQSSRFSRESSTKAASRPLAISRYGPPPDSRP